MIVPTLPSLFSLQRFSSAVGMFSLALLLTPTALAHPPDCEGGGDNTLHDTIHGLQDSLPTDSDSPGRPSTQGKRKPGLDPNSDRDGDGVKNKDDSFPNNYLEQKDSDGDGVGDNSDAFPKDAKESRDSDGDGTGDNADEKFDKKVERKVNYRWSDGVYGMTSKFTITSTGEGKYKIDLKIEVSGERGTWEADWKKKAEEMWSKAGLDVDVEFVKTGGDSKVFVKKGKGRSNAAVWHSDDNGLTAAHEIGHLLGLTDEYVDRADKDRLIGEDDSIMRVVWGKPKAYPRHTEAIGRLFEASK